MRTANVLDAKTSLSRLVQCVESGEEAEIVIARNGRFVARLSRLERKPPQIGSRQGHMLMAQAVSEPMRRMTSDPVLGRDSDTVIHV